MNDLELERYLRDLDRAGLIGPEDKEPNGWVEFSQTMMEDVNSGNMDAFIFILMKMLADYKKACDQVGRVLPNPSMGTGMEPRGEGDAEVDSAALATGVVIEPDVLGQLDTYTRGVVLRKLITPDKPLRKVLGPGEAYFSYKTRKYSKILAEGRYFIYPDNGSFHMLRGHIVRIDKMNKSRMEVTILTGPASDPTNKNYNRFHEVSFPLGLLPSSYFEGQS